MEKVAVITGGSSGIGAAICHALVEKGGFVYNLDWNSPRAMVSAPNYQWISADVRDRGAVEAAFRQLERRHPVIHALVVNAGIYHAADLAESSETLVHDLFSTNVYGALWTLQSAVPRMRAAGGASIVLVASDQAFIGKPRSLAYGMTKAALVQLTKTIAKEVAPHLIRCNCVCPGATSTPLYTQAIQEYAERRGHSAGTIHREIEESYPLQRIGAPEEIANAVVFLLSPESSFITGSDLKVDGGFTLK